MAKRVQFIRHAVSSAVNFLGLDGEITVDLTNKTIRVHDGVTTGGNPLAVSDLANVLAATGANAGKMSAAQATALISATANILINAGWIAGNTSDISDNATDIAANLAATIQNASDISANTTAVLLRAIKDASPTENEIQKADINGDLVGAGYLASAVVILTGAQTLVNKTFTTPKLTSGTIFDLVTGILKNAKTITFDAEIDNAAVATTTINWNSGQKQHIDLDANITTVNFTDPPGAGNFVLRITNAGTFSIAGWQAKIHFVNTGEKPDITDNGVDIIGIYFDGTNYHCSFGQDSATT